MARRKRRQSVDDDDDSLPKISKIEIPLSDLDEIERELIEHSWYSNGDEEDDYSEESYP